MKVIDLVWYKSDSYVLSASIDGKMSVWNTLTGVNLITNNSIVKSMFNSKGFYRKFRFLR